MKKHIFGFALFSSIIVSTALVYAFLYAPRISQVKELKQPVLEFEYPLTENNEIKPVQITQATIDKGNKVFSANIKGDNRLEVTTKIRLHFFVADGNDMRFVATEKYKLNGIGFNNEIGGRTSDITLFSCEWLKKFNSKNNIYVIIEAANEESTFNDAPPKFKMNNAVPVLWIHTEDTNKNCPMPFLEQ